MRNRSNDILTLKLPALAIRNLICEAQIKSETIKREHPNSIGIFETAIKYWESLANLMEEQLQEQLKKG